MQYAPTNPQLNDRRGVLHTPILHTPIDFDNTITVDRHPELVSASLADTVETHNYASLQKRRC